MKSLIKFCLTLALAGLAQLSAQAAGFSATWSASGWSGGYTANLTITNNSTTTVTGWIATFTTSQQETSVWNASVTSPSAHTYQVTPASWASTVNANGGSVTIGFTFNGSPPETPGNFVINGQTVVLNAPPVLDPPPPVVTDPPPVVTTPPPVVDNPPSWTPGTTTGTINFHYYYGVSPTTAEDSLTLDGDKYTDLILSNVIGGVLYGHLLQEATPGIQFSKDYLYGSLLGQLLQENIATEYYNDSSLLIDSSSDQQAVMSVGQGGPYQINNYAVDMVAGTFAPAGFSLINYVAIQKNIGFTMATAAGQFTKPTPASFNHKYYGPILTAYFHFNDYRALQSIGGADIATPWAPGTSNWTPQWQPYFDESLAAFKGLPGSQLDILLNVAYNAGYYNTLFQNVVAGSAHSTVATVTAFNSFSNAWAGDSYHQYPYQVRGYLDQLYDLPTSSTTNPGVTVTAANHVGVPLGTLESIFSSVFQTLAYVNGSGQYVSIADSDATMAFNAALAAQSLSSSATLDLSVASDRAQIFTLLEQAIGKLEANLGTSFSATTNSQL